MMKVIALAILLLLLGSGCTAETVWETVEDTLPPQQVSGWQRQAYSIEAAMPQDAEFLGSNAEGSLYTVHDGAMEIQTARFLASDLDSAVKHLSGLRAEKLTVIQTTRFGLPEYQFGWYTVTEQGGRLCQADLVMDGTCCYAVVTSVAEAENKAYQEACRQVFASFGLYFDEEV